jgi:hypothetical protein
VQHFPQRPSRKRKSCFQLGTVSPAHPVRIKLDNPSSDIRLTVDRTATVLVGSSDGGR